MKALHSAYFKTIYVLATISIACFLTACSQSNDQESNKKNSEFNEREKAEYDYAYALGVQAVIYGWAPVMMDVALIQQTSVDAPMNNGQAPLNMFGPITRLWDYRDRSYTTANNDTYYIQGWADLEEEPIVVYIPPIKNRYWIEQVLDMYTESVVDLCNATVGDEGGYFVFAKRGFDGDIPKNLPVYYSNTRYIWLAGRIGSKSANDKELINELQLQWRLMSLSDYPNGGVQAPPTVKDEAPTVQFPQGLEWFDRLDQVLAENPLKEDANILEPLEFIGIGKGGTSDLSEIKKKALLQAFKDGFDIIVDAAKYSATPYDGWNYEYKAGKYAADYLQRSAINMNSIGLNSPDRAMYPKRYVDSESEILHGKNGYEITLPADMQINEDLGGFWSITMYDAVDRFMVENEINRYKVASFTENLNFNEDGTLTIYISHEKPTDPKRLANWLPAPNDEFMLQCRLYEPKMSVVNGEFKLPDLYKVEK